MLWRVDPLGWLFTMLVCWWQHHRNEVFLAGHMVSFKSFARLGLKLMTNMVGVYVSKKERAQIAQILEPLIG